MNTIKAKVYKVGNMQEFPAKNGGESFKKRELVLDAARFDPYTGERSGDNYIVIEFSGKRCSELDNARVGDVVTVDYVLQGRKFKGTDGLDKFFTSLVGIKVDIAMMAKPKNDDFVEPQKQDAPF